MTAPTSSAWWPTPRPRRFLSNPVTVSALEVDATEQTLLTIRRWVRRHPATGAISVRVDDDTIIIENADRPPVQVRVGEYIVLDQNDDYERRPGTGQRAAGQWTSCPAAVFRRAFQLLPLELPIFDDGEAH